MFKKVGDPPVWILSKGERTLVIGGGSLVQLKENPELKRCRAILLSEPTLSGAARAAEVKAQLRVPLYAHSSHLFHLQRLPALAEKAGLCGVKVPAVDRMVVDQEVLSLEPFEVLVEVEKMGEYVKLSYLIDSERFPTS